MRLPSVLLVVSCAALAASAVAPAARAGGRPACNAKHKRSANPYESILSAGLKPALASATVPSGAKPEDASRSAATAAKPQQVSRAELRASFAPCGRARA